MVQVKRREGESVNSFLYRFTKKIRQSGVLLEAKKRRFKSRAVSKTKRKASAIYKSQKKKEMQRLRKLGKI